MGVDLSYRTNKAFTAKSVCSLKLINPTSTWLRHESITEWISYHFAFHFLTFAFGWNHFPLGYAPAITKVLNRRAWCPWLASAFEILNGTTKWFLYSCRLFVSLPARTEADKTNDRTTLNRALDQRLVLIIKPTPNADWRLPETGWEVRTA